MDCKAQLTLHNMSSAWEETSPDFKRFIIKLEETEEKNLDKI